MTQARQFSFPTTAPPLAPKLHTPTFWARKPVLDAAISEEERLDWQENQSPSPARWGVFMAYVAISLSLAAAACWAFWHFALSR
ncbi:MAG TPA: hypothetical protein VHM90_06455 [Phycisphaerae bacterium]|nr:hypothetical protein [Phycisphaerae bacterium]